MKRLALILVFLPALAHSATRTIANGGGNWSATGTWVEGAVPTNADAVVATATSGASTIDTALTVGSVDFTGMTSSVTHNAVTLTVLSSFTIPVGVNYSTANATTSALVFSNPAGTATITMGGRIAGNITIGGAGFFVFASSVNMGATATLTFTSGTLHVDGASDNSGLSHSWGLLSSANSNIRTLSLGTANINLTGAGTVFNFAASLTNLTVSVNTSTITFSGANANATSFSKDYNGVAMVFSGSGATNWDFGGATITNLSRVGTNTKTDSVTLGSDVTTSKTLALTGNSATNRLLVTSNVLATVRTITVTGSTVTASNVDFRDITMTTARNLSAITGGSGDCGGNTGITFTSADTQTWNNANGGSWSESKWTGVGTSRVPLPQDNVSFNLAFNTGSTITEDMPRAGHDIDWTGVSFSGVKPSWSISGFAPTIYGSVKLTTNMSFNSTSNTSFETRGASTLDTAGQTWSNSGMTFNMVGGTMTLTGDVTTPSWALNNGTIDANNFNVTFNASVSASGLSSAGSATRALKMGSGTWTATATATPWNVSSSLVLSSGTATLIIANQGSGNKSFTGGGLVYPSLIISSSTAAGAAGFVTLSGNNSFSNVTINYPKIIVLTAGSTQTITTSFLATGVAGSSVTIKSSTNGTKAFLNYTGAGALCGNDYLSIQDNQGTPQSGVWYAGPNGTLSSTTGWTATACPSAATGNAFWFGQF